MTITSETTPDLIISRLHANSPRQAYQRVAQSLVPMTGLDPEALLQNLMEQEREAPAGIGGGVAIQHLRLPGVDRPCLVVARAEQPMDFAAVDGQPVDLLAVVLSPLNDGPYHLRRLSRISRQFKDQTFCRKLRGATSDDAIRVLMTDPMAGAVMAA